MEWRETSVQDLPAMATNRKNIHVSMSLPVEKKPRLPLPLLLAGKVRPSITRRDASLILTLEITLLLVSIPRRRRDTPIRAVTRESLKNRRNDERARARESSLNSQPTSLESRVEICPAALQCPRFTSYTRTR